MSACVVSSEEIMLSSSVDDVTGTCEIVMLWLVFWKFIASNWEIALVPFKLSVCSVVQQYLRSILKQGSGKGDIKKTKNNKKKKETEKTETKKKETDKRQKKETEKQKQ